MLSRLLVDVCLGLVGRLVNLVTDGILRGGGTVKWDVSDGQKVK